ncbi:alginate export family protein [Paracoccus sp. WLY502]|uniref:alginate export family protein n=1 Tax=Paracoccus yibinensis TaxID=3068891 RepID=UPI002796DF16|nr:alginate export family protein [Paracoccus sp. WLY502]MDQ1900672.1 alginate export family protein [Paracoccus sp. WLY502]
MSFRGLPGLHVALCAAALAVALPAAAQDSGAGLGGPDGVPLLSAAETRVVSSVGLRTTGSTGDAARDASILAEARRRLGLRPGDRLTQSALDTAQLRLGALAGVASVETRLDAIANEPSHAQVEVTLSLAPADAFEGPTGMLAGGGRAAFPILWQDQNSLLRFHLNGGIGIYSDGNAWFGRPEVFTLGNPLVEDPATGAQTGSRASWAEAFVEFGLSGVTQLGDSNFALYGATTAIAPLAVGQDIFRGDTRSSIDVEKAYAGLLWGTDDRRRSVNLSFGRQNFTLNDGFLVSQFGSQWNAGPRPAVYLAPRTAHDFAAIGTVKYDDWTATAFYLDPNEYEPLESDTVLAGGNLRYAFTDRFWVDASLIRVLESKTRYAAPGGAVGTREGLTTLAAHLRWADPEVAPGVWVEGEIAHQRHDDFDMDAWGGYASFGYIARDLPWSPSLSYRYAARSGDDPDTATYERFDPLYAGGLSEWLEGVSISKALNPANRATHRLRLNLAPDPRLNLTFDWHLHRALELNNLGANPALATLSSHDLGQEFSFTARYALSENIFLLGIASVGRPGRAIRDATPGPDEPWTTLQTHLFWTF